MSRWKMPDRHFTNNFEDYKDEKLLNSDGKISDEISAKLKPKIDELLKTLDHGLQTEVDPSDFSVYTGTTGVAFLFFHLYNNYKSDDDHYLKRALSLVEPCLRRLKQRRITFLCGDAGPLALGAVLYAKLGNDKASKDCLHKLEDLQQMMHSRDLPDECLYGRAGYMYSLLFVRHHLGDQAVDSAIIQQLYQIMISSGKRLSEAQRHPSALMYEWHEKPYLGGAHGLTGIMHILIMAAQIPNTSDKSDLDKLIRPCIDWLITLKFPSGNFPSSVGSSSGDKLIHWCHGAPGWVYMFITAFNVFNDAKYLTEAKSCGDVIWSRGLLRKGYGICHGTAGNGYSFLALYRQTGELKYLHRAVKFAEWCCDYGSHGCGTADRPYSLFEGLAGTIYFLVDLLSPQHSRFPAFEL